MIRTIHLSFAPIFLVLTAGVALLRGDEQPATPDEDLIKGAWKVLSAKDEGRDKPIVIGQINLFDTSKLHVVSPQGRRTVYRYELDPTANPKRMTLSTDDELITLVAIYKLERDTLTLCYSYRPDTVPGEFVTKLRNGCTLLVLKRDTDH